MSKQKPQLNVGLVLLVGTNFRSVFRDALLAAESVGQQPSSGVMQQPPRNSTEMTIVVGVSPSAANWSTEKTATTSSSDG